MENNIAPAISPPSGMGENKPANKAVLDWVHEVESLTTPENVFWCDGSEAENDYLLGEACQKGVLIKLDQEKRPGCYLHRSNPNDVARVEQFTLICTPTEEEAGPTNHWADPAETYSKLQALLKGAMRGRTMFVVPYVMGPPESPLAKIGVRNHRFHLRRPEHADHDPDGRGCFETVRRKDRCRI